MAKALYCGWMRFLGTETYFVAIGPDLGRLPVYRADEKGGPLSVTRLTWQMVGKLSGEAEGEQPILKTREEIEFDWGMVPKGRNDVRKLAALRGEGV